MIRPSPSSRCLSLSQIYQECVVQVIRDFDLLQPLLLARLHHWFLRVAFMLGVWIPLTCLIRGWLVFELSTLKMHFHLYKDLLLPALNAFLLRLSAKSPWASQSFHFSHIQALMDLTTYVYLNVSWSNSTLPYLSFSRTYRSLAQAKYCSPWLISC